MNALSPSGLRPVREPVGRVLAQVEQDAETRAGKPMIPADYQCRPGERMLHGKPYVFDAGLLLDHLARTRIEAATPESLVDLSDRDLTSLIYDCLRFTSGGSGRFWDGGTSVRDLPRSFDAHHRAIHLAAITERSRREPGRAL